MSPCLTTRPALFHQDESANTSLNRSGAGLSPFYPGPTVYGGAANHRRLRVPQAGSGSGSSSGPYRVRWATAPGPPPPPPPVLGAVRDGVSNIPFPVSSVACVDEVHCILLNLLTRYELMATKNSRGQVLREPFS